MKKLLFLFLLLFVVRLPAAQLGVQYSTTTRAMTPTNLLIRLHVAPGGATASILAVTTNGLNGLYVATNAAAVGVNTNAPERSLHVVGTGIISERVSSSPQMVLRRVGDLEQEWYFRVASTGEWMLEDATGTTTQPLKVATNSPDNSIVITTGGVGIRTATPLAMLSVSNTTATSPTFAFFQSNNPTPVFIGYSNGNSGFGVAIPINKLDVEGAVAIGATYSGTSTAPANGLIVEGDTGIGTASPTALNFTGNKLDIKSTGVGASSGISLKRSDSATGLEIYQVGGGDAFIDVLFPNGSLNIRPGSVLRMIVKDTGLVGIGTNAPAARLTVIGNNVVDNVIQFGTTNNPFLMVMNTNGTVSHAGHVIFGGTTAAYPALGRTNGDLVVFGANGLFGGGNTNRLLIHGGLVVGPPGTAGTLTNTIYASATLDFPSTTTGTIADLPITVAGAADGDIVSVGTPSGSATTISGSFTGFSSNGVVYVRFTSTGAAQDPASGTFKVRVDKFL